MLHIGLSQALQTMFLNNTHDALEPGPNVDREGAKRRLHLFV